MKCPLCGYHFTEEEGLAACRGCPLGSGCRLVRCPRCLYEVPREPWLVKVIKSWGRRGAKGPAP